MNLFDGPNDLVEKELKRLSEVGGTGRDVLGARVLMLVTVLREARAAIRVADERARTALILEGCLTCRSGDEYKAMLANLTSVQARGSELITENRAMRLAAATLGVAEQWHDAVAVVMEQFKVPRSSQPTGPLTIEEEANLRAVAAAEGGASPWLSRLFETLDAERAGRGITLPGWTCSHCGVFCGAGKTWLTHCRSCGAARVTEAVKR